MMLLIPAFDWAIPLEMNIDSAFPAGEYSRLLVLGLEVHFTWEPATGLFIHHGDVDSSCI